MRSLKQWLQKTARQSSRLLRVGAAALPVAAALAGFYLITPPPVLAETNSIDGVTAYCRKTVPKKFVAACNETNMTTVRNVATYQCNPQAKTEAKVDCVIKHGSRYIDDALNSKPKPTTQSKFQNALNDVIAKTKKDPDKPAAGFGSTTAPVGNESCKKGSGDSCDPCSVDNPPQGCVQCGQTTCADAALECDKNECDLIGKYLNPAINTLTVCFGLIAALSLILASINYISSGGDTQKVAQAKDRIAKTVFALLAYMFLYSFLQFLIPGGAFNR